MPTKKFSGRVIQNYWSKNVVCKRFATKMANLKKNQKKWLETAILEPLEVPKLQCSCFRQFFLKNVKICHFCRETITYDVFGPIILDYAPGEFSCWHIYAWRRGRILIMPTRNITFTFSVLFDSHFFNQPSHPIPL